MIYRILLTITGLFIVSHIAIGQVQRSSFETAAVGFKNGNIEIAATLFTPSKKGNYPAVVIIHGSGSSTRENPWTSAYAEAFAKRGIIVLYPDKRGSGKTTGNWVTSTFSDLADDAIAGVKYLHGVSKVDKSRVGIIGFSQGGHIVPAAASRSADIAFAISVSGSVVPMMEQIMDEVEKMAEDEGLDSGQIEQVKEINRKGIFSALTDSNHGDYLDELEKAKSGDLKGKKVVEGFPTDPDHPTRKFINTIGDYDPIPFWKKVNVPILFVYGGKDSNIRVEKSINRIENTLGENDYNYSILLFHKNGHAIYREDLLDFMARWIVDNGIN